MNNKPMSKEGRANISAGLKAAWAKRKANTATVHTSDFSHFLQTIVKNAEELGRTKMKQELLDFLKAR